MTSRRWRFLAVMLRAAILTIPCTAAAAQTGIVGGTVYRDTNFKDVLTGVEVTIPTLNRRTVTNYAGDFRFTAVPAGKYAMMLRHLGFAPLTDTVVVADNAPVDKEYSLVVQAVALDSVRVNATANRPGLSPRMAQFEEHRRFATGGHFLTDSVLRVSEDRTLNDLLAARVPGLRSFHPFPGTRPSVEYLSSGRASCVGPVFSCRGAGECAVTLYVDGVLTFSASGGQEVPDMTRMAIRDYAGVEYYAGGASLPLQYNATGSGCGTLVLWTRERLP